MVEDNQNSEKKSVAHWGFVLYNDVSCRFSGPSLIEYLDGLPAVNRMNEGPVRIPILDRYKVRVLV